MYSRQELGFEEFVDKFFRYLINDYEFEKTGSSLHSVQFDSNDRYVRVIHGRDEIDLVIGHKFAGKEICINDIIGSQSSNQVISQWVWNASTRNSVEQGVRRLSELLQIVGAEALTGSSEYFNIVSSRSLQLQYAAQQRQELIDIEARANKAWVERNYRDVVRNYEPYEAYLSEIQQKRLRIAMRKILDDEM